jgi:putative ABC transport system permease protein
MIRMRRLLLRLRSFLRPGRAEPELEREVASHLALLEHEHRRRGLTDEEARLAARKAMGSVALAKDRHRDARSFMWLDDARQDLRFAARTFVRSPGFAAVTIVTMALSIGATTTLFSLAYGVLMRPLPWLEPDRLVRLQETRGGRVARIPWTISNGTYLSWREQPKTVEEIGGWLRSRPMTLTSSGEAERFLVGSVTPSLMRVLRVEPHIGRVFLDSDLGAGRPNVVVLGFGLWQRRFGGSPDVIGEIVRLDGQPYTVIGVMPRDFAFPDRETQAWARLTVVPVQPKKDVISLMLFSAMARLRPSATPPQVSAEATIRALVAPYPMQAAVALFGNNGSPSVTALSARDVMTAEVRPALLILLAAVVLLFLASTASLIVLQLSRVARRAREIAVRTAIGAGSARLIRQWIVESCLLGSVGAASGLLMAVVLHSSLPAILPAGFPRIDDVRLDWRIALFACGVALIVSLACGMVPAFRARRDQLTDGLVGGAASTPAVTRTAAARARTMFMAGQVAVTCILLVGASLLVRSFIALVEVDRGFDPRGLLTMRVPQPPKTTFAQRMELLERLQPRLMGLPGVTDVAFGNALPFVTTGGYRGMTMALPRDPSTKVDVQAVSRVVSPEYFRAMRLRVLQGRPLTSSDLETSAQVIVVNRTFAAQYLGEHAVGQRLNLGMANVREAEVVGVVEDVRQGSIAGDSASPLSGVLDPPQAEIFFPHRQWPFAIDDLITVVRTSSEPAALVSDARALIRAEDATLPVDSVMTMEDRVAASLAGPRSYAVFLVGFALCALAIAGVGLFGVLSYTTSQRTREIGVRSALGARRSDVIALVGRQALTITASGMAVGLAAAFFLSQSLSSLVYGISTRDMVSFVVVPLVLVAISIAACATPAWRATRIDPLVALRAE